MPMKSRNKYLLNILVILHIARVRHVMSLATSHAKIYAQLISYFSVIF